MADKKEKIISFRVSEEEYERIRKLKTEEKITVSDIIRLYSGRIGTVKILKGELSKLHFEIHKIGLNINQIAKANNSGIYAPEDIIILKEGLHSISKKMDEVLFMLGEK